MSQRAGRPCRGCKRRTKSASRYCNHCRPATMIPPIHPAAGGVSFCGLTFNHDQAVQLANKIIDTLEDQ